MDLNVIKVNASFANGTYRFSILNTSQEEITFALVELKNLTEESFWDLTELYTIQQEREKGYATKLLTYLKEYLWNIYRFPIRVHPANGIQFMENLSEKYELHKQKFSDEELDAQDEALNQAIQQPGFWEEQEKNSVKQDSSKLSQWYKNREFNRDDLDQRHLWCDPPKIKE